MTRTLQITLLFSLLSAAGKLGESQRSYPDVAVVLPDYSERLEKTAEVAESEAGEGLQLAFTQPRKTFTF